VQRSSVISPCGVLHDGRAGDEVGIPQPHLAARREAEELLRRVLHEIFALDVELAGERHGACRRRILGIVDRLELSDLVLRIVLDHDLERIEHGHPPLRLAVQDLAHVQNSRFASSISAVELGDADARRRTRGWPAPDSPGGASRDRRHARIVPTVDVALVDEASSTRLLIIV
jgi:hypothetical protein